VLEDHVYADLAQSGARRDREGLGALVAAAQNEQFDVVLVDDLSRLARDNDLMLSVIAELHFEGVRVISVADGLDSEDEEATLGIHSLDNEKYTGRWVWNKTESRRDPRTGRRRRFTKLESEWVVQEDEALRIVPPALWDRARARRQEVRRSWPGGEGRRGFSHDQGGRERHFPTHLLSGSMVCGKCKATIAQVSGKAGGYYGCLGAAKGACENEMLVRRKLAETVILEAVREQLDRRVGRGAARRRAAGAGEANGALCTSAARAGREDRAGADEGPDRPALLRGSDVARHRGAARTAPGPGRPGRRFEFFAMVEETELASNRRGFIRPAPMTGIPLRGRLPRSGSRFRESRRLHPPLRDVSRPDPGGPSRPRRPSPLPPRTSPSAPAP